MYLLDTNIISVLAPTKSRESRPLITWLKQREDVLFLSAVSAAEVHRGIAKSRRTGAHRKAMMLEHWWTGVELAFGPRIRPVSLEISRVIGGMSDLARATNPEFADLAIAATAQVDGLTVLTRNLRHFLPLGVPAIDPSHQLPGE